MLVIVAGMLNTVQCQKPVLVGASGSNRVTTKLLVSAGAPDHDSSGDVLPPPQPLNSDDVGNVPPAENVLLVTMIGVELDGAAGAANGRVFDVGAAGAAAGCVVSVAAEVLPLAADPDAGADPDGVQAATPRPATTAARRVIRVPRCPVRMCRLLQECEVRKPVRLSIGRTGCWSSRVWPAQK
jgi:hypothetical protein